MKAAANRASNQEAIERQRYALYVAANLSQLRQMAEDGTYWPGHGTEPMPNPTPRVFMRGMYLHGDWRGRIEQRLMWPGNRALAW